MKSIFRNCIGVLLVLFSSYCFAKTVNIYDQPKTDAKVVGTMDSANQMVPIISSKDGLWMKIGDPKNGNVGWVKVSDFSNQSGGTSTFGFTQKTEDTGQGPKTIIQFGVPQELTPEQIKEMQRQQAEVQKAIQKMVQNLSQEMKELYQNNAAIFQNGIPMIMPVIVMPAPGVKSDTPTSQQNTGKKK